MGFLNGVQQTVNYWLLQNGHSIGIGDTIPDTDTIAKVQEHIDAQKAEVARLTKMATATNSKPSPGMNIRETFESKVSRALNTARDKAGTTTQKSLKDINNAVTMALSGSKGSSINISQMTALVGQQICRRQAHSLRLQVPYPAALHKGRLLSRGPWLRRELIPPWLTPSGVLLPRHGWS